MDKRRVPRKWELTRNRVRKGLYRVKGDGIWLGDLLRDDDGSWSLVVPGYVPVQGFATRNYAEDFMLNVVMSVGGPHALAPGNRDESVPQFSEDGQTWTTELSGDTKFVRQTYVGVPLRIKE